LPLTSRTLTVPFDVEEPSLTMVRGENEQLRWSAPPAVHVIVVVTLVSPVEENVTEQALYAPLLVKAKVVRPEEAVSVVATVATSPPPAPVQVFASVVAVTTVVLLPVTRLPFTSLSVTRTMVQDGLVLVPAANVALLHVTPVGSAAGCGVSLLLISSLFGAPVSCVVRVVEVPATAALFVVIEIGQVPGVVWAVSVN